jgi:HK97 family phage portal protein
LIKSIKKWLKKDWFGGGGSYALLLSQWNGWWGNSNSQWKYDAYAWAGYMANPIVYRCVNLIADSVAGIPFKLYRKTPDDRVIEIEQAPILDLLKKPNPWMGQKDFFAQFVQYLQVSGNVYLRSVGPTSSLTPKELYFLRPDRIQIVNGEDCGNICPDDFFGLIYEYTCGRAKERIDLRHFFHGKLWNPLCDHYGLSPLQAASTSVDQLNEALIWNVNLLRNSASPSGVLSSENNLSDEQIFRLKEQMSVKYQGVWNSGRPMLLEGGLKFDQMGMSPKDMDWIEGIKLATKNIALSFGCDPSLLGDSDHRTFSTFKDAQKSFYMDTVLPMCDKIRDDFLNNWLLPRFPNTENMYFAYDLNQVEALNESMDSIYKRISLALKEGIISVNEAREALGYSELREEQPQVLEEDTPSDDEEMEDEDQKKKYLERHSIYRRGLKKEFI